MKEEAEIKERSPVLQAIDYFKATSNRHDLTDLLYKHFDGGSDASVEAQKLIDQLEEENRDMREEIAHLKAQLPKAKK